MYDRHMILGPRLFLLNSQQNFKENLDAHTGTDLQAVGCVGSRKLSERHSPEDNISITGIFVYSKFHHSPQNSLGCKRTGHFHIISALISSPKALLSLLFLAALVTGCHSTLSMHGF